MSLKSCNKTKCIAFAALILILPIAIFVKTSSLKSGLPSLFHSEKEADGSLVIQAWETHNGLHVFFSRASSLPIVNLSLLFDAGSARDNNKPGLAALTSELLSSGTDKLSADDVAQAFDDVGTEFGTGVDRDKTEIALESLSDEQILSKSLDTFTAILQAPAFKDSELDRNRNNVLTQLTQNQKLPAWIVARKFYDAIYKDHPYAHNPDGDLNSVKTITRADLQQFYTQYYVNKNATLALVGDLTREQAEKIADQISQALPTGQKAADIPKVASLSAPIRTQVDFNSAQTHIMIGGPGMTRKDKDYFPLYVGNFILGGSSFSSILFDEIRERKGMAYNVSSAFTPLKEKGPFVISLQSATANAAEALKLAKSNLASFVSNGPTDAQLAIAKKQITGAFPLKIDSNSNKLAYVATIGFYDLPLDYLDRFNAKVEAVTKQDIKMAFEGRIRDGNLAIITVGQPTATPVKNEG